MDLTFEHFSSNCSTKSTTNIFVAFSSKLRFSPGITILIYLIYLLPFCFGVFGNLSVCLIFFQQKKLRSITNTFLMNLCKSIKRFDFNSICRFFFRSQRFNCSLCFDSDDAFSSTFRNLAFRFVSL